MITLPTEAQLEAEVLQLEGKLARAKARLAKRRIDPEAKELAIALHTNQCKEDHMEQCGWQWEANNWENGYVHKRYLHSATEILKTIDLKAALSIIEAAKV